MGKLGSFGVRWGFGFCFVLFLLVFSGCLRVWGGISVFSGVSGCLEFRDIDA